jgi:ACS family sodium-dependent inorganic phosphate cotransporter-like MFS transporter 5
MKYSAKMVFGISAGFSAMLGLLSPTMANIDIGALIVLRALQGAFQGITIPAMFVMTAKWLPKQEKARLFSLILAGKQFAVVNMCLLIMMEMHIGGQFGTFISLPGSSLVSHYFGWEYVFYISGSLGMVWFALWMLLIHDSPKDHPRISKVLYYCKGVQYYINNTF